MNKKLLATAIAGALVAPMAAQAIEFKISGHIHRAIRFVDDGIASDVQHVDPNTSRSRFKFVGSEDIGNGMTAGIYFETSISSSNTGASGIKTAGGDTIFDIRHSALYFSGGWGTVWMGHTNTAADGIWSSSFAASGLADGPDHANLMIGGSVPFRTAAGGSTGITPGGAFASFTGSRTDTLRYDTPKLGPATLKISVENNEAWGVGAYLDGALGGGKYQLKVGYDDRVNKSGLDQWAVSGAYLFSQGTNVAFSVGERTINGPFTAPSAAPPADRDADGLWLQLGHNWGNSGVSISWGETQDLAAAGVDATQWRIGFGHKLPKPGIDIYATYSNMDLDGGAATAAATAEDIDVFAVGTRIQFK